MRNRGTIAERWHYEAEKNPGKDGLTLFLVTALLFTIFVLIGFGLAMHKTATDGQGENLPASVEVRQHEKEQ